VSYLQLSSLNRSSIREENSVTEIYVWSYIYSIHVKNSKYVSLFGCLINMKFLCICMCIGGAVDIRTACGEYGVCDRAV
jgi:hypothetical protein